MAAALGEFDRIAKYFKPLAAGFPGALGLTDDAALISPGMATSLPSPPTRWSPMCISAARTHRT